MLDNVRRGPARPTTLFQTSILARPAPIRVLIAILGLVPLWVAIAWAVAVP